MIWNNPSADRRQGRGTGGPRPTLLNFCALDMSHDKGRVFLFSEKRGMIWPPGARPGGAVSVRAGFGVTVPRGPNRAGAFGPITVVSLLGRQLAVTGRGSLLEPALWPSPVSCSRGVTRVPCEFCICCLDLGLFLRQGCCLALRVMCVHTCACVCMRVHEYVCACA